MKKWLRVNEDGLRNNVGKALVKRTNDKRFTDWEVNPDQEVEP